jgi:hypothetical protein
MRLSVYTMIWTWLAMTAGAATEAATTVSRDGWTIAADVPRGVLSISHERLGPCPGPPSFALREPSYKPLSEPGLARHSEVTADRPP